MTQDEFDIDFETFEGLFTVWTQDDNCDATRVLTPNVATPPITFQQNRKRKHGWLCAKTPESSGTQTSVASRFPGPAGLVGVGATSRTPRPCFEKTLRGEINKFRNDGNLEGIDIQANISRKPWKVLLKTFLLTPSEPSCFINAYSLDWISKFRNVLPQGLKLPLIFLMIKDAKLDQTLDPYLEVFDMDYEVSAKLMLDVREIRDTLSPGSALVLSNVRVFCYRNSPVLSIDRENIAYVIRTRDTAKCSIHQPIKSTDGCDIYKFRQNLSDRCDQRV